MNDPGREDGMETSEWTRFCQRMAQLEALLREAAPDEQTRAQAEAYLARLTVYGLERTFLATERQQKGLNFAPARVGGFNPDFRMGQAPLDARCRYRLTGRLNDAHRLGLYVYSVLPGGRLQLDAFATQRMIDVDAQGRFAVTIEAGAEARNHLGMQPTSNLFSTREIDLRVGDQPAELQLECLDGTPDVAGGAGGLSSAAQYIEGTLRLFLGWTQRFAEHPNRMIPLPEDLHQAARGDPGTLYYVGSFNLSAQETLEIELPKLTCDYWGVALSNYWLEPLKATLNHATARADSDGICRVRLSRNPTGYPNGLDTGGLQRGVIWYRTIDADREAVPIVRMLT